MNNTQNSVIKLTVLSFLFIVAWLSQLQGQGYAIEQQIKELDHESFEQSVTNISDVNLFYWPGPVDVEYGFGAALQLVPLQKQTGQTDIEAIMSNRRFRKILVELDQMDKHAAAEILNRELSALTGLYLKLYDTEMRSLASEFTTEKLQSKSSIAGPAFASTAAQGDVVIRGARLGVLSLVWTAGLLNLSECKMAVERVVRISLQQRSSLYGDPKLHDFFKNQMLERASLYNRQILSSGLLGTMVGDDVNALGNVSGIEWQDRKLVSYRAQLTEYDLPVVSGGMKVDGAFVSTTVRFVSPLDDSQFDALLSGLRLNH